MKQWFLAMGCIALVILAGCKGKEEPIKSEKSVSDEEVKKEAFPFQARNLGEARQRASPYEL